MARILGAGKLRLLNFLVVEKRACPLGPHMCLFAASFELNIIVVGAIVFLGFLEESFHFLGESFVAVKFIHEVPSSHRFIEEILGGRRGRQL